MEPSRLTGSDRWVAITLSDTTTYSPNPRNSELERPRALFVGVGGDVALEDGSLTSVTFKNVPSGTILPVQPNRIMSTNTTATNIVGLY